jgi:hypothetical protein
VQVEEHRQQMFNLLALEGRPTMPSTRDAAKKNHRRMGLLKGLVQQFGLVEGHQRVGIAMDD